MKSAIVAWQGVLSEPLKSLLAIVALTLGMLGFVSVTSAQGVLEQTVQRNALLQGGPVATYRAQIEVGAAADLDVYRQQISNALNGSPVSIMAEAPDVSLWIDGVAAPEIAVRYVDVNFRSIRPLPLMRGEWPTGGQFLAPRVVLNQVAFQTLDIGARFELGAGRHQLAAVVSGVVDDGESSPNVYADWRVLGQFPGEDVRFAVLVSGQHLTSDGVHTAGQRLTDLGSPVALVEVRRTDTISSLTTELRTTGQVLVVLAILSLVSTVVGVANVGLSTVRARSREYALRRALGASRVQIAIITLMESQIVAIAAAGAAFGLAALTYPFIAELFSAPSGISVPEFPLSTGWLCLLVASSTGLLASIVPAIRSSGPDVSSVMRV